MDRVGGVKNELNLRYFLEIAFQRKFVFFITFIVVFSAVMIYASFLPKVYKSEAKLLVETQGIRTPVMKGLVVGSGVRERLGVAQEKTLSRTNLKRLIKAVGLYGGEDPLVIERMLKELRRSIDFRILRGEILQVSYVCKHPELAQRVVEAVTQFLVEDSIRAREKRTSRAFDFLKSQIGIYRKRVDELEEKLYEFDVESNIFMVSRKDEQTDEVVKQTLVENILTQQLMKQHDSLEEVRLKLKQARRRLELLAKQVAEEGEFVPLETEELDSPIISRLRAELVELETTLAVLKVDATEDHPSVIEIKKRIDKIQERIEQEKQLIIEDLKNREKELVALIKAYEARLKQLKKKELERAHIQRELKFNEAIYQSLLKKLEAVEMTRELEKMERSFTFVLLDPPSLPVSQVAARIPKFTLIGLVAALMASVGMVVLVEICDRTFRDVEEVVEFSNVPVIGLIPSIKKGKQRGE